MTRRFEIEFPDELGAGWMNRDNLLICLTETCQNTRFTVTDITDDGCDQSPASLGPRGHGPNRGVAHASRG